MDPKYAILDGVDSCITNAIHVLFESCRLHPRVWLHCSRGSEMQNLVTETLLDDYRSTVRSSMCEAICAICTQPARLVPALSC